MYYRTFSIRGEIHSRFVIAGAKEKIMSKVRGPLHSIGAHGTIGKTMIHQVWKGIPRVKKYRKPTQPNSAAQLDKRNLMRIAIPRWQGFVDWTKNAWKTAIERTGKTMSGYNFFLSQYLNDIIAGLTPSDHPPTHLVPAFPVMEQLISWWKLDEGQGNNAADSYGVNNGTIPSPTWIDGVIGKALYTFGSGKYVTCPDHPSQKPTNGLTCECWAKFAHVHGSQFLISKIFAYAAVWWGYALVYVANKPTLWICINGNTRILTDPIGTVDFNWHHLTATYDGNFLKIYFDGNFRNQIQYPGTIIYKDIDFRIGNNYLATYYFRGSLDEVRTYSRALSQEEITYNFNLR